jgi:hypothetical protein
MVPTIIAQQTVSMNLRWLLVLWLIGCPLRADSWFAVTANPGKYEGKEVAIDGFVTSTVKR